MTAWGPLFSQLEEYESKWNDGTAQQFKRFLTEHPNAFERTLLVGHLTASALVVDASYNMVLLTHHRKLGKWLQLGGHCDGNPRPHETALRECEEESGLTHLQFLDRGNPPIFFDLDIHEIPERKAEPRHDHFDLRYLIATDTPEKIVVSDESHDLKWFTLEDAYKVTEEKSMHRQFDKFKILKAKGF